ncbi:MAG: RIP metalloprotease RseP [Rhodobacteraceae bacterium]|nr:RIP metalloprotease RseP [Paracoccaceae bacterium]
MIDLIYALDGFLWTVVVFLAAVSLVVFVHEYGHYLAARLSGIEVTVFSVGFGPALWKRLDRQGTEWRIAALPIGGYVKFSEEKAQKILTDVAPGDPAALQPTRADSQRGRGIPFEDASLPRRAITVAAGPIANFIASIIIFAAMVVYSGIARDDVVIDELQPLPQGGIALQEGDRIVALNGQSVTDLSSFFAIADQLPTGSEPVYRVERGGEQIDALGPHPLLPLVSSVRPISAADEAGLTAGDVILAIDGQAISSFAELSDAVQSSEGYEMDLDVWRQGAIFSTRLSGELQDIMLPDGSFEQRVLIGVNGGTFFEPATVRPGPWQAVEIGISQTTQIIMGTLSGIVHMVRGDISTCNLQGPIGIARVSAGAAEQGGESFIRLIAFLSTAIGFVNLLPIPILDGGHLVLHGYEAVARRRPPEKLTRYLMMLGLAMIILLMSFGLFNDLTC